MLYMEVLIAVQTILPAPPLAAGMQQNIMVYSAARVKPQRAGH
jgi:hypothetical protein